MRLDLCNKMKMIEKMKTIKILIFFIFMIFQASQYYSPPPIMAAIEGPAAPMEHRGHSMFHWCRWAPNCSTLHISFFKASKSRSSSLKFENGESSKLHTFRTLPNDNGLDNTDFVFSPMTQPGKRKLEYISHSPERQGLEKTDSGTLSNDQG